MKQENWLNTNLNDLEGEIWKDLKDFEGLYQVSNYGRIKSLPKKVRFGKIYRTTKLKILSQYDNGNGYKLVYLGREFKAQKVHRLVAKTFIPNPDNLPQVNHKDENRANNNVKNLEWCDATYNINYGNRLKKFLENRKDTKNNERSKPIVAFSFSGDIIHYFPSLSEAQRNGFDASAICECCKFKRPTHKNLIWRYVINKVV